MRRLAGMLLLLPAMVAGQANEAGCEGPRYALLDFWVGEWTVWADGEQVGVNRIDRILKGCAVTEHWRSAAGREGRSLFYVDDGGAWKQVWVTERATETGGVKEKTAVPGAPSGSVRFRGRIETEAGSYLDRTTLTPRDDGSVRQHIEVSTDDGATWRTTFDATYRRAGD